MTIDEAIENLENPPAQIHTTYYPDFPAAIKLGIEALKRVKAYKDAHKAGLHYNPMPGETEG